MPAKKQPVKGQRRFDFGWMRDAFLEDWPGVGPSLKLLIRVMEDLAVKNGSDQFHATLEELGRAVQVTPETVGKLVAEGISRNLIFEMGRPTRKRGRRYKVGRVAYMTMSNQIGRFMGDGPGVADLSVCHDEEPESPRIIRGQSLPMTPEYSGSSALDDPGKFEVIADCSPRKSRGHRPPEPDRDLFFENKYNHPPPPSGSTTPTIDGWREVEEVVSRLVGNWEPAVAAARSRGCTPAHVLAMVAEAERRRPSWSDDKFAGRLYRALLNAHPARTPDSGWPGPDATGVIRQRAAVEASQRAMNDAEESARQAQREVERRRRIELEEAFGLDLDTMPEGERNELVRAAIGANRIVWGAWVRDPDISAEIFRGPVLRYMAKQEGVTVTDEPA